MKIREAIERLEELEKEYETIEPCARCKSLPEVEVKCTLINVRCLNRKCNRPTQVGWHRDGIEAVGSWNKKMRRLKNEHSVNSC